MKKKKITKKDNVNKPPKAETVHAIIDVESRREFLQKLWKGLGIIAAFEFAAVFFGF